MEGVFRGDGRPVEAIGDEASSAVGGGVEEGGEGRKMDDRTRMMRNYLRKTARIEWRQLATVLDRILFIVFFLVLAGLTLAFSQYI